MVLNYNYIGGAFAGILLIVAMVGLASTGLQLIAKAKCKQAIEIGVDARVVNNHRCFAYVDDDWVEL